MLKIKAVISHVFFLFCGYEQQELAAVFKKIGDKQTCTIGLYELYRITQLYPKVLLLVLYYPMACKISGMLLVKLRPDGLVI